MGDGQITVVKAKGFTTVFNAAFQRKDLSWKAKGLLIFLLTCAENWVIYKKDLKNRSTDGYDSTVTAFNELQEAGYIEVIENRDNGLFSAPTYLVHESPIRDFPEPVSPESENPRLINKPNKKEINKGSCLKLSKEERKVAFKREVSKYYSKDGVNGYDAEFLKDFFDYWTESSDNTTKLRFEDEKFFDLKRRLSTFKRKEKPKQHNRGYNSYQGQEVGN